ncbi:hypothetical protein GCM10010406_54960 [Streptomyces thermolineatus]|uniref:GIY-YIG catalytic domain-containing protein n=1 Tax=Streptomyces thermolineatus TaxID=44033 RepID=A0ABP6A7K5_9ACTN
MHECDRRADKRKRGVLYSSEVQQPWQRSPQNLRTRVRYHFRGNAAGSTPRLTLGCLLGLELRRFGKLIAALRREGAGPVRKGRPWSLPPATLEAPCLLPEN